MIDYLSISNCFALYSRYSFVFILEPEYVSMYVATGMTGNIENFSKPIFQTFGMFTGMTAGLVMHFIVKVFKISFPGYKHDGNAEHLPMWMYLILIIPSIFDLTATALCMFGLMDVNVRYACEKIFLHRVVAIFF